MDQAFVDENDNTVKLTGLRDDDGQFVDDATVQCVAIEDSAGDAVTAYSGVLPIAMPYVTGSDGIYRGTFSGEFLTPGQQYTAIVEATGGGLDAVFNIPFTAQTRTNR